MAFWFSFTIFNEIRKKSEFRSQNLYSQLKLKFKPS